MRLALSPGEPVLALIKSTSIEVLGSWADRVAEICYILLDMALLTKAALMNAPFDPTLLMNEKFAVGQPV